MHPAFVVIAIALLIAATPVIFELKAHIRLVRRILRRAAHKRAQRRAQVLALARATA